MSDNLHSHHIFIFPFKWEMKTASKKDFAARTNINLIRNLAPENFKTGTSIGSWKCFSFDWTRDYSEAIYFNGYTRDVLFDRGGTIPGPVLQYHIPGKGQFLK